MDFTRLSCIWRISGTIATFSQTSVRPASAATAALRVHGSGGYKFMVPQAVPTSTNEHVISVCHPASLVGSQEGPRRPSGRAAEHGSVALSVCDVEAKS